MRAGTKWTQIPLALVVTSVLALASCGGGGSSDAREALTDSAAKHLVISETEWEADESKLKIKGTGTRGESVSVYDADSGSLLGTTDVNRQNEWQLSLQKLVSVPCRVRIESGDGSRVETIADAPNCTVAASDNRDRDNDDRDDHDRDDDDDGEETSPAPNPGDMAGSQFQIFAANDLGMHCMDEDFSVFSILPPFNTLQAQVLRKGGEPALLDASQVEVRYSAVADASGSINTTSAGKTNFWDYVQSLFDASPAVDVGLTGAKMPSNTNGPQSFANFEADHKRYVAQGIPITPWDDNGQHNSYPLFRIDAVDKASGLILSSLDTVVPVSEEMACADCHNSGREAADAPTAARYGQAIAWSTNANPGVQYKENILLLHDVKHGTFLFDNQPVLCADCHYSPALDLAGAGPQGVQRSIPFLSFAIHERHGETLAGQIPGAGDTAIVAGRGINTCYNCHPGQSTQCFRGAMANADLVCQDCHGGMLAVAGTYPLSSGRVRQPWIDLPKCQSCHTGDVLNHQGNSVVSRLAYRADDPAASPLLASNKRFAEADIGLYRNSAGHGGMDCTACHGSPHAIWPNADPHANDNVAAQQIQGYSGTITECGSCHTNGALSLTLNGPHGLHNVDDPRWTEDHGDFYERNPNSCRNCHGSNLEGTRLSRTAADRIFLTDEDGGPDNTISLAQGTNVSCTLCHERP